MFFSCPCSSSVRHNIIVRHFLDILLQGYDWLFSPTDNEKPPFCEKTNFRHEPDIYDWRYSEETLYHIYAV